MTQMKRLYRSQTDKMLNGVCGGLGEYFGIDPTIVRLIFVAIALSTGPGMLLAYLILAVVVPPTPLSLPTETTVEIPSESIEEPIV